MNSACLNTQSAIIFPCGLSARVSSEDLCCRLDGETLSTAFSGSDTFVTDSEQYAVVEFTFPVNGSAQVLGDGFQMLAQTAGTLNKPIDVGRCPDNNDSYRIYSQNAPKRYYNYLVIEDNGQYILLGFTSCRRFSGYFEFSDNTVKAYIDAENKTILQQAQQDKSSLESITALHGPDVNDLYLRFTQLTALNHQPRSGTAQKAPVGWCSWYAYYAGVSEQNIHQNVDQMSGQLDALEWVLLDDGYQAFMGDWLVPSDHFSGGVKQLIKEIKAKGKKPAIWMAPFIAQAESNVFKQHPEWFVRNSCGELLKAEEITYGGWRCTPWYILDCSHPEVCAHLTRVVRIMREEWGVELFKLDANYWGTLKGLRYQSTVTGVQAYRMGMQAIAEGAGDAWLLGCNAPIWPSLGLVDAMRVSDDVERQGHRFEQIAKETFQRSWQHRRLWQIDPDCATLISIEGQGTTSENYHFHRDVLLACGGLLLSGDPLYHLDDFARQSLTALINRQKITQFSAVFSDLAMSHAVLNYGSEDKLHLLFNYQDQQSREVVLESDHDGEWCDYWTGENLSSDSGKQCKILLKAGLNSRAVLLKAKAV
ncbi:glycoside hydrolase family 36 protein [Psychromonas ossibalaenae]|uniref:glycoside hydrolase family 36 protein n=1 Tax=Psychromonas ossibalaenae TaxID=444922 RepID=UPI00037F67A2|nr:alpha-galactosidase [Psychromonas ossibalaenae]